MTHHFELSEDGRDTLILVFPPAAVHDLAERLASAEKLHGPLPAMMQAPVKGAYTEITRSRESSGRAND